MEKLLPPLPAPCSLLPGFYDWTEQLKAPKREGQTLKAVLFLHLVILTRLGVSNWLADILQHLMLAALHIAAAELTPAASFSMSWK